VRALKPILWLLLLTASYASAYTVAKPPDLHLRIDSVEPLGNSEEGTALARVFFKVYTTEQPSPETLWTRDVDESVFAQIHLDGQVAPFIAPPDRVRSEVRPVAMVFLMAIDVSGSMGGFGSWRGITDYDRRMLPLRDALLTFFENNSLPHVFARLYPFSHLVPHPVGVASSAQDLAAWEGRYLSLTGHDARALKRGVADIDLYVRNGDRNVDTSLYAAYLEGLSELDEAASIPAFRGAKRVLILLTDGMNDPRQAPEAYRSLLQEDVMQGFDAEGVPAVYTIGFGLDDPAAIATMENFARLDNVGFTPVAGGDDAAPMLRAAYEDVVELEGRSWYVDIDTGKSRKQVALEGIGISVGNAPPMNDRMLLLPSAGVEISTRYRLIALDLIGLVAALLLAAWALLFARRDRDAAGIEHEGTEPSAAPVEIEPIRLSGMSVQEWRRQRDSQSEGTGNE
jgi:hypothetical protein